MIRNFGFQQKSADILLFKFCLEVSLGFMQATLVLPTCKFNLHFCDSIFHLVALSIYIVKKDLYLQDPSISPFYYVYHNIEFNNFSKQRFKVLGLGLSYLSDTEYFQLRQKA